MLFVAEREQMTEPTPGDLQILTQDLARALGSCSAAWLQMDISNPNKERPFPGTRA